MPLLDVSDILTDPDFASDITLCRRTQSISQGGVASISETQSPIVAVVTQGAGDTLQRLPEGAIVTGAITIHTQASLQVADGAQDADEIIFMNRRYIVSVVSDYSYFGAGFTAAVCTTKPLSP